MMYYPSTSWTILWIFYLNKYLYQQMLFVYIMKPVQLTMHFDEYGCNLPSICATHRNTVQLSMEQCNSHQKVYNSWKWN